MFAKVKLKLRAMGALVIFVYKNLFFRRDKAAQIALICISLIALYSIKSVYVNVLMAVPVFFPYASVFAVAIAVFTLLLWGFFLPVAIYFIDSKNKPERMEALADDLIKKGLVEEELVFTKEGLAKRRAQEKPQYYA